MKHFYNIFSIVTIFPGWRRYLQSVYRDAVKDGEKAGIFLNKIGDINCLLCGVSGEITADEFLKNVFSLFPNAKVTIIDLGDKQIQAVNKMVEDNYSSGNITVQKANALDLGFICNDAIDWIDTDGFFSFFDTEQLTELFKEWKRILKKDGVITFRELVTENLFTKAANSIRVIGGGLMLGTKLYPHTIDELVEDFNNLKFRFTRNHTPIPLLDRYCLVN